MSDWNLVSEQERALATVAQCGLELWEAQQVARRANEALRRAIREVTEAEDALGDATRRLHRFDGTQVTVLPRVANAG